TLRLSSLLRQAQGRPRLRVRPRRCRRPARSRAWSRPGLARRSLSRRLSETRERDLVVEEGLEEGEPLRGQRGLRVRHFDDLRLAGAVARDGGVEVALGQRDAARGETYARRGGHGLRARGVELLREGATGLRALVLRDLEPH